MRLVSTDQLAVVRLWIEFFVDVSVEVVNPSRRVDATVVWLAMLLHNSLQHIHRVPKRRLQIHGGNSANCSQPIFEFVSLSDSPVNFQQSTYQRSNHTSYASLYYLVDQLCQKMGQSQTNALINHKVQSTLVIYLRCGGIVNLKKN